MTSSCKHFLTRSKVYDSVWETVSFVSDLPSRGDQIVSALNPQSSMGSVISSNHLERIERMIQTRQSGEIVAGGERMTGKSALDDFDFSRGTFYPPTVITNVDTRDEIWQEEIFGPVVVVNKFRVSSGHIVRGCLT